MSVTRQEVEKVAVLAKLKFGEQELDDFTRQFNQILDHINTLNELDTTNVEPTTHVLEMQNVFREDVVKPSLPREEILKNAPAQDGEFFKVPKVIK